MPIYEYKRPDGTTFDVIQSFSDDPLTHDPETGVEVQRVLHAPAVHFKGSGFYNTDYGTRRRQRENAASGEGSSGEGSSGQGSAGEGSSDSSGAGSASSDGAKGESGAKSSGSGKANGKATKPSGASGSGGSKSKSKGEPVGA